jgi:hypothetical protein
MTRQILNGWKEISKHIERGVRTAQRWEATLGMPVHRPALKDRSAVVAFTDELERWISRTASSKLDASSEGSKEALVRVHENMSTLAWHTSELASQTIALQEQLRRSLEIHRIRIASRMRTRLAVSSSRSSGAMLPFRPMNNPGRRLLFP